MGWVCKNCGVYHDKITCSLCGVSRPPLGISHVTAVSALREAARQNIGFHQRNAEANKELNGLAPLLDMTYDDFKDYKFNYRELSPLEKALFDEVYTWVGAHTGGATTTEVE